MIVNAKEVFTPAVGLDGETFAVKHLAPEGHVDVRAAAGAASIPTPSMLAASTKKEIRPTLKPALGMVAPSPGSTNEHEPLQNPALPEDPATHSHMSTGDVWTVQLCIRQASARIPR